MPDGLESPTSLECRQIAELLADYVEGTLDRATTELIDWHIDGCAPCVAFVRTYQGTINAAAKLRETTIPPEVKARLVTMLRARRASERAGA